MVAIFGSASVYIENNENYQKQSYRNRCNIFSANGIMSLSIPICHSSDIDNHSISIDQVKIDYSEDWVHRHKRALDSAYKNSPFFDYYRDDIYSILDRREEYLLSLNTKLLGKLIKFCGGNIQIKPTNIFSPPLSDTSSFDILSPKLDLRSLIHPKQKDFSFLKLAKMEKPYWQVFSQQGFIPDLSIIDLLFNEGPNSLSYLI